MPPRKATKTAIDARPGIVVQAGQLEDQSDQPKEERESRDGKPQVQRKPQWSGREADDAVGRKLQHLGQRILRVTGEALFPLEADAHLAESNPAEHSPHVAVRLAHGLERLERPPVDESEVAHLEGHVDVADAAKETVERGRRRLLETRFPGASLADAVDHVESLAPTGRHLQHDLRGVLEIGVHDDDRVAGGDVHAGGDRDLVTEVPGKTKDLEARIGLPRREHQVVAAVAASVVDEDDLGGRVEAVEQEPEPADELGQGLLLVENRDDE